MELEENLQDQDPSFAEQDEEITDITCKNKNIKAVKDGKVPKRNKFHLTGLEVVQILTYKKHLAEVKLYYLKEVDERSYRPYDLKVVHSSEAGSEHYIFSPNYVVHMTEMGYGGLVSLAEWYREYVLWTALQKISYFRCFRLRKAFTWWIRNVRKALFKRRCKVLQDMLLAAVPLFRRALYLVVRLIEELKETHLLPLEESKTYTLSDFRNDLITKREGCLRILEELSQSRAVILNVVKEKSYKAHQELQLHMEYANKPNKYSEPIHVHLAHRQSLKKEQAQSGRTLKKLGSFAYLINQLILQGLISVIRDDVFYFLNNILKRTKPQQCCLFINELCFNASNHLTVDQPVKLFQEAASEALLTVGDSIVQMCDTSGFFLEIRTNVLRSDFAHDLTPDLCERPVNTEGRQNGDRMTGRTKFCCWQLLKELSDHWLLLLPKQALLMVQGNMVRGCYYPLSKTQLEWHISISDTTKHVATELTRSMQEAEVQNQQLLEKHSWLVDIYLFISQWTPGGLDSMKGQPALLYEELIQKLRHWAERINMIPSSLSTSNLLFVTHCTNIKEALVQQLRVIEKEVLQELVEQIRLHSDDLISDLERVSAELKMEPQHLSEFSNYALTVRESAKMLSDVQKRKEYIHSLQNTTAKYREMTEQEITLEKKMLGLWEDLIPLLKQADSAVCRRLPSMANALDTMLAFVVCDLKNLVSKATSGAFVDPSQDAKEMATKLNNICTEVYHRNVKLEQLARNSQNLQEHTLDLTILTTDLQKVKARKELWELKAAYTTLMEEWEQVLFSEVLVSQAQGKVSEWKEQAMSLTSVIPTHDPVLQETVRTLENVSHQLALMAELKAPRVRHKHWEAIFDGMGLQYVPEKVTVAELMNKHLELHQKHITKICMDAQAECNMEESFQKLCQRWEDKLFWLERFPQSELQHGLTGALQAASQHLGSEGRFIIIGLEIYCAEIENDRMTLSTILRSPYSVELRLQIEGWIQSLQELEQMLDLFKRYQQMWAFLMKMFNETFCSVSRGDLLEQFQPVDDIFKEIMHSVSTDRHVLNFINSKKKNDKFHGHNLCQILIDGLLTMESLSQQMLDCVDAVFEQFPRLWFLSDREVIELLSHHPAPLVLEPFVCKCFKGIRGLKVDSKNISNTNDVKRCVADSYRQMKVLGIFSSFQEHIAFVFPVEPNLNTLVWMGAVENQLKLTMVQLLKQCAAVRNQLEPFSQDLTCHKKVGDILCHNVVNRKDAKTVLDLVCEYPLQCLLVAEEAVWRSTVLQAFQESSPVKLSSIKAYHSAKLKNLLHAIGTGLSGKKSQPVLSKYAMMCVRALVQLTMNHVQQLAQLMETEGVLDSSFEWISMMKYYIIPEAQHVKSGDDTLCYVDIFGHRFQYGFEYFGPEDWIVNNPSTERAMFGILLALSSYRCGFLRGPCMSGKNKTVVHLGKALGRQVATVQCFPSMTPGIVQKRLLGALYTGALLLLDSVNLLTQEVLSSLAQYLVEIHQSFSDLTNEIPRLNDNTKEGPADLRGHMTFAGKRFSANINYGCVLISSRRDTPEVPPSLQFATRPIALTHPDYRIIVEVRLTSAGFLEALSLSQRLVSLISLAKDSLCLPDVLSNDQCSYLVLLEKIISASEVHLQQSVRQQGISTDIEEPTDPMASHNVPTKNVQGRKERLQRSRLSVKQGLIEETAIVKAIMTVLVPVFCGNKKASQFDIIFKEVFPIASQFSFFQHYIEEQEKNQIKTAVTEYLRAKQFQPDAEVICNTVTLYQSLKFSQTVLLIGPPGCGKTTCYCALAGALNGLAANGGEYEHDSIIKTDTPQTEAHISATKWNFIDTMVIFPNGMFYEEVFGCLCDKHRWQDGVLTKILRETEQREKCSELCNRDKKIVKWLIMDGEPVGQPGWMDYVTTLCSTQEPLPFPSSAETSEPSKLHPKLLLEVTDLSEASPSAVTRCSLVHVRATDLWKTVWKSELEAVCCEHRLDQKAMKMWNRLAEDLFSSTFTFLRQKSLNAAIHVEEETCGLQEIMSFVRILRALLHYFGKEKGKIEAVPQLHNTDTCLHEADTAHRDSQSKEQFARDLFLVAYTWGFGGHLHPRHWPQFDLLVRQVLFNCRYKIVVPDKESVFEHFLIINSKTWPTNTLLTNYITPKYEKYAYLLNLMLEANQPVLLAGEPGSGKTMLCQTLLGFDKPHISLAASPRLSFKHLHHILTNTSSQKYCEGNMDGATKQPRLLLFVDDLHEAPRDVFGKTSMALELLRESMSKGQILSVDTYCFKFVASLILNYMVTGCYSEFASRQVNAIPSRLLRLFSIFVLPCLSVDSILSIHSPKIQVWLKEMPLKQRADDMACRIIAATKDVYHVVSEQFPATRQRPHFLFSQRDLHKVFCGMYLWQPNIPTTGIMQKNEHGYEASVVNIVQLWMHECLRTFSDRLCSEDETRTLVTLIAKAATTHFRISSVNEDRLENSVISPLVTNLALHTVSPEEAGTSKQTVENPDMLSPHEDVKPSGQSELQQDCSMTEPSLQSENLSEEESLKTLQHMEELMSQLVFGPDLLEPLNLLVCKPNVNPSYNKLDLDALMHKMSAIMDLKEANEHDINNKCNIRSRYIVTRQRVSQLLHILRALLMPGGHGVLMSSDRGTGRKTTVRLAAYLTGYRLMEVHSANENKLHEILKEAGNETRVSGRNVIILVHEGISQCVREELLVAMAQRTYPALYTEEEIRNRVTKVTAVNHSRRYLMDSWTFEKYLSQVHKNVHVFLLMSFTMSETAIDGTSVWNGQMSKALSLSCCIEVYQPWSNQCLMEAATQSLPTSLVDRGGSEPSLSVAMAGIHQCACQYASVLLGAQPFSPQTYTELIAYFGYLYNHLQKQWQSKANRIDCVVAHLDAMNTTAENYKQQLKRLQQKVSDTQQREQELLRAVDDQSSLAEEAEKMCLVTEKKLYRLEEQIHQAQRKERPIFQTGLKILQCLNPSDLEEVRHYRDPPDGVVKVMDAICLLFNHPPGWESTKLLLGRSNFFQDLEFFDRNSLTNEQLQQLSHIVHSPQFAPESVREVSKACESLCRWVQALYEWCSMKPQLSSKQQLEALAREVRGKLHHARQHKKNAFHRLRDLKLQLQFTQKDLEQQLLELCKYEHMDKEATAVVGQLKTHTSHWKAATKEAELQTQNIPGDALILAAVIVYLGPFAPETRTELLSKWRELCQRGSINISPEDPRTSLVMSSAPSFPPPGFPISLSEKLQQPLGQALGLNDWQLQDTGLARLLVWLLLWGYTSAWNQHWPLLADIHDIGLQSWHTTGGNKKLETEFGIVISAADDELLDKLDQAAEKGLMVLVTHVEKAKPSPQLLDRLVRSVKYQHVQPPHPEFRLFLSTHLPVQLLNNEIHPSILSQVHVVDLSLSSEEIQDLMLTTVLQSDCKKLLIQHLQLQSEKHLLQEKLFKEQDALVDFILQSNTSLQDSDFVPCMTVRQEAMEKLQSEIKQLSDELEYHESLVTAPRHLARLAAALYQSLQDVSRLSPAYYFSLHGFIGSMRDAMIVKDRPLVALTFGKVQGDIVPEITNRMVAQLLAQYRPCLFKSHIPVLKLLVSVALLQYNGLCSEGERVVFLKGLEDIDHTIINGESCPPTLESTSSLPNWIPAHIHPELLCLEKLPSFRGLVASLSAFPMQWQEYLHLPSSAVIGRVPCRSHAHLSLLQRALLWKTMATDSLQTLAETIAACNLCSRPQAAGVEVPHTWDPGTLSQYIVKHEGPIILTLPSPRGGAWTTIQPLDLITKMALHVEQVQVKVVFLGALCESEVILSALDKAIDNGHWLVFSDCHLLEQWNSAVVVRLSRLIFSVSDEPHPVHPCFRLWFITQEHLSNSIPAALRIPALPLVCDSPFDLKEELSCSFRQVASLTQCQSLLDADVDAEALLCCAVFHSVLLQRQSYKCLGRGRIYNWSQEDLQALMNAHNCIARVCHNRMKVLQYMAVNLVHGSHVLDSADLDEVENLAKILLSKFPPVWASGAKVSIISSPDHLDLSGLMQILSCHPDSPSISEPLMLGFSAELAAEIIKLNSHNLNILLQVSQTPLGIVRHFRTQPHKPSALPTVCHARERLQALKSHLTAANLASTLKIAGAVPHSPLRDFLQDEWDELIDLVSSLVSQLQQPVQYSMLTFAFLLELSALSRLERRAELLSAYLWHHNISDPAAAYRLSAFRNGRGFLVAVIREAAHVNRKYIGDISLQFQVVSDDTDPASLPLDAVYLCGLELRGATWDSQHRVIQDTTLLQPCLMPLVCLKAQVRGTDVAQDTFACKRSYLTDTRNVPQQLSDASAWVGPRLPVYHCPLYRDDEMGDWGLEDSEMITTIPLHTRLNPVLCSLRRMRLVSTL